MLAITITRCTTTSWIHPATRARTSSRSTCRAARSSRKSCSIERSKERTHWKLRHATERLPPVRTAISSRIQVNIRKTNSKLLVSAHLSLSSEPRRAFPLARHTMNYHNSSRQVGKERRIRVGGAVKSKLELFVVIIFIQLCD
jgi:hypothetical protein